MAEDRRLLADHQGLLSVFPADNGVLSGGQRYPGFPADLIDRDQKEKSRSKEINRLFGGWLPIVDAYRNLCLAPSREVRAVFEAAAQYQFA